jgi:hypothetical protein
MKPINPCITQSGITEDPANPMTKVKVLLTWVLSVRQLVVVWNLPFHQFLDIAEVVIICHRPSTRHHH